MNQEARRPSNAKAVPSVLISGRYAGAGKTTLAEGLIAALRSFGMTVQAFKVGCDPVDCAALAAASSRSAFNLDPFLMSPGRVLGLFNVATVGADIAVVEGVAGINTYRAGWPATLVVAAMLGSSVIHIRKQVNPTTYELTVLPSPKSRSVRHIRSDVKALAAYCLGNAEYTPQTHPSSYGPLLHQWRAPSGKLRMDWSVGIALDEAFGCCAPNNIQLSRMHFKNVVHFSPLRDEEMPGAPDFLYFSSRSIRMHASRLSENTKLHAHIRRLVDRGCSVLAEGDASRYLFDGYTTRGRRHYKMLGLFPGMTFGSPHAMRTSQVYTFARSLCANPLAPAGCSLPVVVDSHVDIESSIQQTACFALACGNVASCTDGFARGSVFGSFFRTYWDSFPCCAGMFEDEGKWRQAQQSLPAESDDVAAES